MNKKEQNTYPVKSSFRHLVFFLLAGCLLAGFLQRWMGLERTPEYDELYTLKFFASRSYDVIFRDVATPNNHTLNSWSIRFFLPFFQGRELYALRLGAFAAGISLLLLALYTRLKVPPFKKRFAGGFFLAFIAFNGALLHYSATGRGYSFQAFFVFGAALSLLYLLKKRFSSTGSNIAAGALFILCSLGAILSVSTGILYITGLGAGGLFLLACQYWKERGKLKKFLLQRKHLWITGGVFAILSLSYYLPLAGEFMKGTSFGSRLDLSFATLQKAGGIILENDLIIPLVLIAFSLLFCRKYWKWMVFFLIAGSFPFLSGFIFRAGPARVYMPAIPLFLAAGALGGAALAEKYRKTFFVWSIPLLLAVALFYTSPNVLERLQGDDLGVTFSMIRDNVPRNLYPVFMPTESVSLESLYREEALRESFTRMEQMEGLLIAGRGIGVTALKDGSTQVIPVPDRIRSARTLTLGGKQKWNIFPLAGMENEAGKDDFIFLWCNGITPEEVYPFTGKEFLVNFRQNRFKGGEGERALFLIPGKEFQLDSQKRREMEEKNRGMIKFLVLKEK